MASLLTSNRVLVLNKNWHPVDTISLQDAIVKLFCTYKDGTPKARVVDPESYRTLTWEEWSLIKPLASEDKIVTSNVNFKVPKIIILSRYEKVPKPSSNFSSRNLYKRDRMTCFVPDTNILMSDYSLKPISEIVVGDTIRDAYDKIVTVEHVHVENVNERLVVIQHEGNSERLTCTKTHKLLTFSIDNGECINKDGIPAGNINVNTFISELVPNDESFLNHNLNVYEMFKKMGIPLDLNGDCFSIKGNNDYFPNVINCDFNFGNFVGHFFGNGLFIGEIVAFHEYKKDNIDEIKQLCKNLFNIECIDKNMPEVHLPTIYCNSEILYILIKQLLYHDGIKRLMDKRYPHDFLRGVISGFIKSTGGFSSLFGTECNITAHKCLIRDIYIVASCLNLMPILSSDLATDFYSRSISFKQNAYNKILDISGVVYKRYEEVEDFIFNRKLLNRKLFKNNLVSKVTSISEIAYNGPVYDLQVSGSHTYVANFVCVHNCQYCGIQPGHEELTTDHVVPKSQGGLKTWENCVLACVKCNRIKADRTPKQAKMTLRSEPKKPSTNFFVFDIHKPEKSWEPFLGKSYWNVKNE